jgi:RNA polymerase sigma-70 factor (ECF subfamily)
MEELRMASDEELWARAAANDGGAFGEMFERHADAVYTHCFRRTGSWSMAEDLTSVVFLEAWRRRREVRFHGQSALPWLLGVANNATRNMDRSLRRQRRLLTKLPRTGMVPDPSEEAIERVDDERAMLRVLAAFKLLNNQDQDVLSLIYWAGLSYTEAAVALALPVGTVRSRLSRARGRLRVSVSGDAPQGSRFPEPMSSRKKEEIHEPDR